MITAAHRIRLNPTSEQEQYFYRCAGVARFAWNWGLAAYNDALKRGERPNVAALKKEFNRRRNDEGFAPWVAEVQSYAYQYAFADLGMAVNRYFQFKKASRLTLPVDWHGRRDGLPFGWPRFKSRDRTPPAFGIANTCMRVDGHQLRITRCPGMVNMAELLRLEGKIMSGRVSRRGGRWYIAITVETEAEFAPAPAGSVVGIDLGVKSMAVTSDGEVFANLRHMNALQRKRARLQRELARRTHGGANWRKTRTRLQRVEAQIADRRRENLHVVTSSLATRYEIIAVENLNVSGMVRNHNLARAISDVGFYEFRRQLEYKTTWRGGRVVAVDTFFPSSRLHNLCGWKNDGLTLGDRQWTCGGCGAVVDRDLNAAANIRDEGLKLAASAD